VPFWELCGKVGICPGTTFYIKLGKDQRSNLNVWAGLSWLICPKQVGEGSHKLLCQRTSGGCDLGQGAAVFT